MGQKLQLDLPAEMFAAIDDAMAANLSAGSEGEQVRIARVAYGGRDAERLFTRHHPG